MQGVALFLLMIKLFFLVFPLKQKRCAIYATLFRLLGQVCHVAAAVVAHKGVFIGAARAHLFATFCANAVVVGVYFIVTAVTFHSCHLAI